MKLQSITYSNVRGMNVKLKVSLYKYSANNVKSVSIRGQQYVLPRAAWCK